MSIPINEIIIGIQAARAAIEGFMSIAAILRNNDEITQEEFDAIKAKAAISDERIDAIYDRIRNANPPPTT